MSSPVTLTDTATVSDLLLEESQIDLTTLGHVVVQQFEQRQRLPGVVVLDGDTIVGLISRRQLYQSLSQPYALEIFLRRPIRIFLDLNPSCRLPLILNYQESVQSGVRKALSRPAQDLFEPLVVQIEHPQLPHLSSAFLLDFHTLMLAHTQIAAAVNQKMQDQQRQLLAQQTQLKTYAQQLERHQGMIAERNNQLDRKSTRLNSSH